jgi:hypothetical protein
MMGLIDEVADETDEWDFDRSEHFICSSFTWNKDKTKLRIGITSKEMLTEYGFSGKVVDTAPEKYVLIEFNGKNMERLKQFMKVV